VLHLLAIISLLQSTWLVNSDSTDTMDRQEEEQARCRRSEFPLVEMQAAVACVLEKAEEGARLLASKLRTETVSAASLCGRVLREDVQSAVAHPPFRASIFDGYAIGNGSDASLPLSVRAYAAAGDVPEQQQQLQAGDAAWVTTGAPVPPGSHCVVKVEDTQYTPPTQAAAGAPETEGDAPHITINGPLPPAGDGIREPGSDIVPGSIVLAAGTTLSASDVGVAAAAGHGSLAVRPKVRVGVLSTGSELQDAHASGSGSTLNSGKIFDSNRVVLLQLVRDAGCDAVDLGIVGDTQGATQDAIREAMGRCDVLLTSGGVSMGDKDFVKQSVKALATVHFGRLFMKPGKPTVFATASMPPPGAAAPDATAAAHNCMIFALPGNPVSTWVTFHLLVLPALRVLSGGAATKEAALPPVTRVTSLSALRLDKERPEFHRVQLHCISSAVITHRRPQTGEQLAGAASNGSALQHSSWWGSGKAASITVHTIAPGLDVCAGDIVAVSTGMQRSSRLQSTIGAAGLLVLPPASASRKRIEIGEQVPCIMLCAPTVLNNVAQASLFDTAAKTIKSGAAQASVCGCGAVHTENQPEHAEASTHAAHHVSQSSGGQSRRPPVEFVLAVVTVSDRASAGEYEDKSGPAALRELGALGTLQAVHTTTVVVSDEPSQLLPAVQALEAEHAGSLHSALPLLIVTSGGTGFTTRDRTPETLGPLVEKHAPGLVHILMQSGLQHTPLAILSRPIAGVTFWGSLLVTLPGKPKAVVEGIHALAPVLAHALKLIAG